jgi:plastocyanin
MASGTKLNDTAGQFYPEELKIGVNNFVVWKNNDIHLHRIKSIDDPVNIDRGEKFGSGDNEPFSLNTKGDLFVHRFTKTGEHHYYCKIHTNEKGTVTVN